tara:strand:- start:3746 stop:5509 length:1764 start_codon:yes stop_codon:yes gene_type:complete
MKNLKIVIEADEMSPLKQLAESAVSSDLEGLDIRYSLLCVKSLDLQAIIAGLMPEDDALVLASRGSLSFPDTLSIPAVRVTPAELVRDTRKVLSEVVPELAEVAEPVTTESGEDQKVSRFLVGVTSCPTGIAHTFMAAEALVRAATAKGYTIKVETRGSVGAKNELTEEEIAKADAVVVAADANVETTRFSGKRLLETGTKAAINDAGALIDEALSLEVDSSQSSESGALKRPPKKQRTGAYKHLMTGVSHMLPLVVAGGLLIALAFAVGGIYAGEEEGTLGSALMQIGAQSAFALFIPVLAGYIAFSIADRPGLTPGLVGGMLAVQVGAGFLGGLAAGFLAGYLALWLNRSIKLPDSLEGLKPVLILPLLSTLIVGLGMIYVVGPPVKVVLEAMSGWLGNMQEGSAITLGLILGGMMAFDMGGPVNKAAYTFSIGLLATDITGPMAAVMAGGMVPPLACAAAANIARSRFTKEEREASKATAVLGLSFITEGAIPFAAADPLRVIPCMVAGSAVTGALSMYFGCELMVPHGGIFVMLIPNAIVNGAAYLGAIAAGCIVATTALCIVKKPLGTAAKEGMEQSSASVV